MTKKKEWFLGHWVTTVATILERILFTCFCANALHEHIRKTLNLLAMKTII